MDGVGIQPQEASAQGVSFSQDSGPTFSSFGFFSLYIWKNTICSKGKIINDSKDYEKRKKLRRQSKI